MATLRREFFYALQRKGAKTRSERWKPANEFRKALIGRGVTRGAHMFGNGKAERSKEAFVAFQHAVFGKVRFCVSAPVPAKPPAKGWGAAQLIDAAEQRVRILRGHEHAAIRAADM